LAFLSASLGLHDEISQPGRKGVDSAKERRIIILLLSYLYALRGYCCTHAVLFVSIKALFISGEVVTKIDLRSAGERLESDTHGTHSVINLAHFHASIKNTAEKNPSFDWKLSK